MHCDTAEHTAPRQEHYYSFLHQIAFPEYVKREIAVPREWSLAAIEARVVICQLHMETWQKNIQWHIGTSHHFSLPATKPPTTIQAALCALTKDERCFFAIRGGTQGCGINTTL